jgi:hypothetical protein
MSPSISAQVQDLKVTLTHENTISREVLTTEGGAFEIQVVTPPEGGDGWIQLFIIDNAAQEVADIRLPVRIR